MANPFGHRNCDMPIGGTQAILHKLNAEIASNFFEEPNLIIVTGGIVTEQPGQLDYERHLQTIKESYTMLKETFPNSFVFPVLGGMDFYPQNYSPMNTTTEFEYKDQGNKDWYRILYEKYMEDLEDFFYADFFNARSDSVGVRFE